MSTSPIQLDYAVPLPKLRRRRTQLLLLLGAIGCAVLLYLRMRPVPAPPPPAVIPLKIQLPKPIYVSTPRSGISSLRNLENPNLTRNPPTSVLVPPGATNLALNKPVTGSDPVPILGDYSVVTDGSKEGTDGNWVELNRGSQWIQVDLQKRSFIYAIALWHYHATDRRIYKDVVARVSDDPDFAKNVVTIFNNDDDNSSGLGKGTDLHWVESDAGKVIDGKGVAVRYVRLYSNGNNDDPFNHVIEVEVHGVPVPTPNGK